MPYKLTFEDGSEGYLSHFGVKGMHWGVWNEETRARRLGVKRRNKKGSSDDSAAYTRDGLSLIRKNGGLSSSADPSLGYRDQSEATTKEFKRLEASAKELDRDYDSHRALADKVCSKVANDASTLKEARSMMKKDLVSYDEVDDKELIDVVAYDTAQKLVRSRVAKTPEGRKVANYEKRLNGWFDDVRSTTDKLADNAGNKKIKAPNGKRTDYKKVVNATLLDAQGSTGFLSYAARQGIMDDVINNSKAVDDLQQRIVEDFKKR